MVLCVEDRLTVDQMAANTALSKTLERLQYALKLTLTCMRRYMPTH